MKVRNGFVSNSSSSSFIVAFDYVPTSIEELKEMIFGDAKQHFGAYGDDSVSTADAAKSIWNQLVGGNPLSERDMIQELENACDYPGFREPSSPDEYSDEAWAEFYAKRQTHGANVASDFIERHPKAIFYKFVYADEDGQFGSIMEHGNTFRRVPHVVVSHH